MESIEKELVDWIGCFMMGIILHWSGSFFDDEVVVTLAFRILH